MKIIIEGKTGEGKSILLQAITNFLAEEFAIAVKASMHEGARESSQHFEIHDVDRTNMSMYNAARKNI